MSERSDPEHVWIFDTTLRDGEQSPGASMNLEDKIRIAQVLEQLGVDVIEAGFPIASPGDFEAVSAVAKTVQNAAVAGLCRCQSKDITRAWDALRFAKHPRIHVFLATSPIHREHKLRMDRQAVLKNAYEGVKLAAALCPDVEFSAEDASRTEPEFLAEVLSAVVEAGATTLNVPDTVGYAVPEQYAELIQYLKSHVRGIESARLSVHCHNDLGMAVANSLAAVRAGARQIECTINGIGERAGNASLEEVVMALRTRSDYFHLNTNIQTEHLHQASRLVSEVTGLEVQRNKAIVGRNAFAHEAGIHQHGVLQNAETYEIMRPQDVGVPSSQLVLGKHSGRHALQDWLNARNLHAEPQPFETFFQAFKCLADERKNLTDLDIEDLWETVSGSHQQRWALNSLHTSTSKDITTIALVVNTPEGQEAREAACGSNLTEALFQAFRRLAGLPLLLRNFQFRSWARNGTPQGEVRLEVQNAEHTFSAVFAHPDPAEATARALCRILNRIESQYQAQTLRATS
ncbi:MAG: 2-isopropylmalate synthase [Acidobacteria bacterium]|nr:2-isopropylmalate synthase [Acidobacteriota bacterium]MCB9399324.1 2-isopropylmalate synthase [Acidobacteriota bacterium]